MSEHWIEIREHKKRVRAEGQVIACITSCVLLFQTFEYVTIIESHVVLAKDDDDEQQWMWHPAGRCHSVGREKCEPIVTSSADWNGSTDRTKSLEASSFLQKPLSLPFLSVVNANNQLQFEQKSSAFEWIQDTLLSDSAEWLTCEA